MYAYAREYFGVAIIAGASGIEGAGTLGLLFDSLFLADFGVGRALGNTTPFW
jgi:hypothetical protein